MPASWQTDWTAFVNKLSEFVTVEDPSEALAREFSGKSVTWTGVLDEKSIDALAPIVGIGFKECMINVGRGRVAVLDGFTLALDSHNVAAWRRIPLGSKVTFTATMGSARSPFPAIQVKHLKSGESVILMGLSNGELLGVEAPPKG